MIKSIAVAVLCLGALAVTAKAQTSGDTIASRYVAFKKSQAAVRVCANEEGRMQIERNQHYDALLNAGAQDAGTPTIDAMSAAQARLRLEDEALSQKRDECTPLFDQLVAAARELQRDCEGYAAPDAAADPTTVDALVIDICRRTAKSDAGFHKE